MLERVLLGMMGGVTDPSRVGLDLPTATQVVHGLAEFRDPATASGVGGAR